MVDLSQPDRVESGAPGAIGPNVPLLLDDPAAVWLVEAGEVAVFAVGFDGSTVVGPRHYVFSVQPGGALFGMDLAENGQRLAYLAVGLLDARVRPTSLASLREQAREPPAHA